MTRFLVLQHVAVEHPALFRDCMRDEGIAWDTVELDEGETIPGDVAYDALIVMGGPMDTWEEDAYPWLVTEKRAIHDWVVTRQQPFLGVCLGHQLLAAALGGDVGPGAQTEVGVMPVALTAAGRHHPGFAGFDPSFAVLQWHGAEVRRPPAGASVLAQSPSCAVQAMACGPRALSIQFHVEAIDSTVDDWAAIPAYADSLERALGADGAARLRDDAATHMTGFNRCARRLWRNWRAYAFA